jgi:Zn-dependent protease with chaperone function/Tfp pilus assembly protein PilE
MICPKCGYERKDSDNTVSPEECPKCHVIYTKVKAMSEHAANLASESEGEAVRPVATEKLVYKNEPTLFVIHFILSTICWLALIILSIGTVAFYALAFFIGYLFVQSALIAHLKGNGVKINPRQFPDLYKRYVYCCKILDLTVYPDAYLINGNGLLNAFATRFLGRNFVVLNSNVVEGLAEQPEVINFYLGHELGHVKRKHLQWGVFLWPASFMPLIGAAYSRAREYTCDQFGRACCANGAAALKGLIALSAGEKLWAAVDIPAYLKQAEESSGFWMSFHELVSDYPWLVKRAARMNNPGTIAPSRDICAWILALFIPRFGCGGAIGGLILIVAISGILAAIAVPQFNTYRTSALNSAAVNELKNAKTSVESYYVEYRVYPETLEQAKYVRKTPKVDVRFSDRTAGRYTIIATHQDSDKEYAVRSESSDLLCRSKKGQSDFVPVKDKNCTGITGVP